MYVLPAAFAAVVAAAAAAVLAGPFVRNPAALIPAQQHADCSE